MVNTLLFLFLINILNLTDSTPDENYHPEIMIFASESTTPDVRLQHKQLGEIRSANNGVLIRPLSSPTWMPAENAQPVSNADSVRTIENGFAVIQIGSQSVLRIKPNSLITIHGMRGDDGPVTRIRLEKGEMMLQATLNDDLVELSTPSAIVTGNNLSYIVEVHEDGSSVFTGLSGTTNITALNSGEMLQLMRRNKVAIDHRAQLFTIQQISNRELNRYLLGYDQFETEQ